MTYGYIRVSTDKQDVQNQKFEIKNFATRQGVTVDEWVEETISGTSKLEKRKLASLLKKMKKDDVLIASELSRLGRNLMQIMSILSDCLNREMQVWTIKDNYRLGNDIQSKVLAFAFGLSAEIERNLISQRTKEALQRRKSEGQILGRPIGSKSDVCKLTGKEEQIKKLLEQKISLSGIGRIVKAHRLTVANFCRAKGLIDETVHSPEKKAYYLSQRKDYEIDFDDVIEMYRKSNGLSVIAKKYGINSSLLKTKLVEAGLYVEIEKIHNSSRKKFIAKTDISYQRIVSQTV